MSAYARFFAEHRALVLVFALLLSAAAALGLTRLEFDDVPRELFASEDEAFAELLQLYEDFGSDDNDALLVLEAPDWFDAEGAAILQRLARDSAAVTGVRSVLWFGSVPVFGEGLLPRPLLPGSWDAGPRTLDAAALERARELALAHPLTRGRLLSEDGRVALFLVRIEDTRLGIHDIEPAIVELRALAQELGERHGPGRCARVTGVPTIRVEIYRITQAEQRRFFLLGAGLCALLALVLFRSVGAVLCATIPPVVGALWAFGCIGLTGARLDILGGVLSMLVIVIALTDSVHLMIDVRLSRSAGLDRVEAAVAAIRHLGVPCALTSLTTAVGFGSLALANVPAIRKFGLLAAVSVVVAFLAVITLLPLLASVMPRVGERRGLAPSGEGDEPRQGAGPWERCARPVIERLIARPGRVAVIGTLLTVTLALLSVRLRAENRLTEALPHGDSYQALMRLEEAFGGVLPCYVVASWDEGQSVGSPSVLAGLDALTRRLEQVEGLGRPFSVLDLVDSIPGGRDRAQAVLGLVPGELRDRLLRSDLRRTLVHAPVPDGGVEAMGTLFARIRAVLAEVEALHPELELSLTGTDIVARTNVNRMIDDLARSLTFAVFVIFVVIALEFRSLRLGLISLLPNVFPLVLVGGVLQLSGRPLQMASAVLFTVLLGLAVDDTIHFLARVRRERAALGEDAPAARWMRSSFLAVGRAIAITTLILVTGFATVGLSSVPTNRVFAALACLGLGGAVIGDLLFLPALLVLWSGRRRRGQDSPA